MNERKQNVECVLCSFPVTESEGKGERHSESWWWWYNTYTYLHISNVSVSIYFSDCEVSDQTEIWNKSVFPLLNHGMMEMSILV